MRTARLLFVLAVTAGMLVLTPQTSWACSCAVSSTAQQVHAAGTVVDGTLDWVATNSITTTYSVKVSKVFKGRAAAREKLVGSANAASCGLGSLATRKRYLFFIEGKHPGKMSVSLCGGTTRYDATLAAKIQRVTGRAPTGPSATPGSKVTADDDGGRGPWLVVGAATALAILAALVLLARRRA